MHMHVNMAIPSKPQRQIHVFITGLNTVPTYCHVCQHLISLLAYASKCQLCSFTCHSNCGQSANKPVVNCDLFNDPLKYCHLNYVTNNSSYAYISRLASLQQTGSAATILLADYLFIYVDRTWKKVWLTLRADATLAMYQNKRNSKPFDTISLNADKVQLESSTKRIGKIDFF